MQKVKWLQKSEVDTKKYTCKQKVSFFCYYVYSATKKSGWLKEQIIIINTVYKIALGFNGSIFKQQETE